MTDKTIKIIARDVEILCVVAVALLLARICFAEQSKVSMHEYEQKLSPDGSQIVFVRAIKNDHYVSDEEWYPSNALEIWAMNADGGNQHCIIKSNHSKDIDMDKYLGSFEALHWSPDGKYIYFLCQNSTSNAVLYRANRDGTNIKRLSHAHGIGGVVGGSPKDEYYGYIVVYLKKYPKDQPNRWVTVLMTPDGKEVKEIDDIDVFLVTRMMK